MYIYNCIYIHITNRWYDMYTANRGYAMDTCIMCIYTICTVYTRLCTYIQYIYNFMSLYIYIHAYIHYSIIIYGLPFFFNASPLRGPYFTWGIYRLHPAALPSKAPSSLWAQLCSQGFFHGWPRTERWGARLDPQKQTFFSPATKSRFPPANLKIVQKTYVVQPVQIQASQAKHEEVPCKHGDIRSIHKTFTRTQLAPWRTKNNSPH